MNSADHEHQHSESEPGGSTPAVQAKLRGLDHLGREVRVWRHQGDRIVFTNGCFDLLHAGHVSLLSRARRLGDHLIVAVNDDASVSRLKGRGRPLNPLALRVAVLAALEDVDRVLTFSEDTPSEVLGQLRPDILVKGGDYSPEQLAGRQFAAQTVILPLLDGVSTTRLAHRLSGRDLR